MQVSGLEAARSLKGLRLSFIGFGEAGGLGDLPLILDASVLIDLLRREKVKSLKAEVSNLQDP